MPRLTARRPAQNSRAGIAPSRGRDPAGPVLYGYDGSPVTSPSARRSSQDSRRGTAAFSSGSSRSRFAVPTALTRRDRTSFPSHGKSRPSLGTLNCTQCSRQRYWRHSCTEIPKTSGFITAGPVPILHLYRDATPSATCTGKNLYRGGASPFRRFPSNPHNYIS